MALKTTDLGSPSNGSARVPVAFTEVITKLREEGSVEGFKELRNYLLANFSSLKKEFGAANVISLAIACDRHAIFADLSASKTKEKEYAMWKSFQRWLKGDMENYEQPAFEDVDVEVAVEDKEDDDE